LLPLAESVASIGVSASPIEQLDPFIGDLPFTHLLLTELPNPLLRTRRAE